MKKLLLTILWLAIGIGGLSAQTTIYAYRTWQQSGGDNALRGPVKFQSDNPGEVTTIADQSRLGNVYAGTYYNYKWYAQVTRLGTQSTVDGFYTIDLATGERTLISTNGSHLVEMAYDYSTGTMYAIRSGAQYLMTVDIQTGETFQVSQFGLADDAGMLALACSLDGTLYGVGTDDNFYTINKSTGEVTLVGALGVNAAFTQSMGFDYSTGVLYWVNNADYGLYTIDTATGDATPIDYVGANDDDSISSLFVPFINVPAGAPDRVTGRSAAADGSTVVISWTNPTTDAQGNALTALSGVRVERDGLTVATVTAYGAGQQATYTDTGLTDGNHSYRLIPFNDNGDGGVDTDALEAFVGQNAPGAVGNFTVTAGDSQATLSWTKPAEGMYGGSYDPESVTGYVITRYSTAGTQTINAAADATSYVDSPSFGTYTYSIYAVNAVGDGVSVSADPVMVKPADWIIMTTGEAVVETGKTYYFYDPAGPNAYYPNSCSETLTIRPQDPNALVKAEFTVFDFDTYGDYLRIYNGASTDAPLIGEYSAEAVPSDLASLESTSADGALTFEFYSDVMSRYEGWAATVTASVKKSNDLEAVKLSGELYPAAGQTATYSFDVRNRGINAVAAADYTVRLLDAAGNVLATANGVDLASMEAATIAIDFSSTQTGAIAIHAEIAYAADDDTSNNASNTLNLNVLAEGSRYMTIGDSDSSVLVLPISFMSGETISQTIYYANEIGIESGKLIMVGYNFAEVGTSYSNVPVKVWVGETTLADLSEASIPASEQTLMFDGTISVTTADSELVFQFEQPYAYNGGNLVVTLQKNATSGTSYDVSYVGTYGDYYTDPQRSRFDSKYSDTEPFDPNASFAYSGSTMMAQTNMLFTDTNGSVGTISADKADVKVYPNPVAQTLFVSGEGIEGISVFSMAGQLVASAEAGQKTVDVASLPAGIYLLKAVCADGSQTVKKFIKK